MAALLSMSVEDFCRNYVEASALGPRLTVADTGFCVFLQAGNLCRVHPVKPFICRQWPFLPALLVNPDELEHAKGACPGLNPACTPRGVRRGGPEPGQKVIGSAGFQPVRGAGVSPAMSGGHCPPSFQLTGGLRPTLRELMKNLLSSILIALTLTVLSPSPRPGRPGAGRRPGRL